MKRFIAAFLFVTLLISALVLPAYAKEGFITAPNPNAAKNSKADVFVQHFKTANDPEDYLQIDITGEKLTLSGQLMNPALKYICVSFDLVTPHATIENERGKVFKETIDLSKFKEKELELSIFVGGADGNLVSAFYGRDIVLEKRGKTWGIVINKMVYDTNLEYMQGWMWDKEELSIEIPQRIRDVAMKITAGYKTAYDKARAIHEYVANYLYYDMDYAMHIRPSTFVTAEEVFDKRIAVCEGYTNLTVALLRSVDIPAAYVEGYALGVGSDTRWEQADLTSSNHAWVEAYVDGKWIIMDTTWDSKNVYQNGVKNEFRTEFFRYFDSSVETFSLSHYIISRPNSFGKRGASSWALPEAKEAYSYGLVTKACRESMPDAITRLEFCDLLMNMLSVKLDKSVERILSDKGVSINEKAFTDTTYYNVLAANALGLVNGKGEGKFDPEGTIKRQEAAAMLQRAAVNVLGVKKANSKPVKFTDDKAFASWGQDAIAFVSASVDKNGRSVMGGKEGGRFAPDDLYTKEQSVLTILRLYTAY
ncbi:MAG: S-layer homology domain-containing protein [Clostridia bacterium]|nr:S-layer homology domain-containing protein [Clostridia bacterium]